MVGGPQAFEVWRAQHPLTPHPNKRQYLARFRTEADALVTINTLNQIWNRLRTCRDVVRRLKIGDGAEVIALRYRQLNTLLQEATQVAARESQREMDDMPDQVSRVFSLLHRTVRDCSSVLVHYRHENNLRVSFTRLMHINKTIEATNRKLKAR